jgi:hypothetical protein
MKIAAVSILLAVSLTFFPADVGHEVAPRTQKLKIAQMLGWHCQTRFGICPILDGYGNPVWLPVGSPCGCGLDPGFVIP